MSTYDDIKSQWMKARKAREPHAKFLGTLKAEIDQVAKDEQRDVTEADVQKILKKFAKGLNASLEAKFDASVAWELNVVESFMPQVMTEEELNEVLDQVDASSMPEYMQYLKAKYGDRVDMKMAAKLVKARL